MRRTANAPLFVSLAGLALLALGCGGRGGKDADGPAAPAHQDDHAHERGKMLIADAGKYHALLTAHLSPKGNELDIFLETTAREPTPVAIPVTSFTAFARRQDGEKKELLFECAPASERPKGEKEGTCSHWVARTPWLRRDEELELTIPALKIDAGTYQVRWKGFTPAKYAHHDE